MIKRLIERLFFKYCYDKSEMARYIVCYWVPDAMRNLKGERLTGQLFFAEINHTANKAGVEFVPLVDVQLKEGKVVDRESDDM